MRVQFIIKKRLSDYGETVGLFNAAKFVSTYLTSVGIENIVSEAIDGNCVDRLVTEYNPDKVFIEALWITPAKFQELLSIGVHKEREWIVRLHSKIPFLSQEGIAIDWIKEYYKLGILIAPNNQEVTEQLDSIGIGAITLSNIYYPQVEQFDRNFKDLQLDIGCMGAIRPMKNQLLQAFAAIDFADSIGKNLCFYINANRAEQNGENNLKNIRALFKGTKHTLVEIPWLDHKDFVELTSTFDLGMQISFTESFNIVTADFVNQNVPILVSEDISWMPEMSKVCPTDYKKIVEGLHKIYKCPKKYVKKNYEALQNYNKYAKKEWNKFLDVKVENKGWLNKILGK